MDLDAIFADPTDEDAQDRVDLFMGAHGWPPVRDFVLSVLEVAAELGLDAPADLVAGPGGLLGAVETALKGADAGAPPRVADTPNGFFVVQRTE